MPITFKLGSLELPADAVTQRFAFLAKPGAGKTYAAGVMAEQFLAAGAQVVAVDPLGVWYGLRLAPDGKTPSDLRVYVLGGLRGDAPLTPESGAMVAELVVGKGLSAVLDVSTMRKGERKRFCADFGERLFELKKASPSVLHVFLEEAHTIVPQFLRPDDAKMFGAWDDIVKLGRNFGIGTTLIDQRAASVNKDVLNMSEVVLALQTTGKQDRKALRDWMTEQEIEETAKLADLAHLGVGEAWVWSPGWLRCFQKIQVQRRKTFAAGGTPTLGAAGVSHKLAPMDLAELREAMASTLEKSAATDPVALRKRIAALEQELKRAQAVPAAASPAPGMLSTADVGGELVRQVELVHERFQAMGEGLRTIGPWLEGLRDKASRIQIADRQARGANVAVGVPPPRVLPATMDGTSTAETRERAVSQALAQDRARSAAPISRSGLVGKSQDMLDVLAATRRTLSREQLALLALLSLSGTFDRYLSTLKGSGLVEVSREGVRITERGLQTANRGRALPPSDVLAMNWEAKLTGKARTMFRVLFRAAGAHMSRANLAREAGLELSGTFDRYLSDLRGKGLAVTDHNGVRAVSTLFLEGVT